MRSRIKLFKYGLILLMMYFNSLSGQGFVVDHNCVDINKIPSEYVNQAKKMFLIHTGGSHGMQVPVGLENLVLINSDYAVNVSMEDYPSGSSALKVSRSLLNPYNKWKSSISPDDYWNGDAAMNNVRRTLNYYSSKGIKVDAILHTWCWHLRTATEEWINQYLINIETLEAEYPGVTFIYMTDTADKTGAEGLNRWQRHEQIREYCRNNNKVLFDFGELETWSADGSEQLTTKYDGVTFPYWHDDWSDDKSNDYGHINKAATIMKAKAMWWLMAQLAGWEPEATEVKMNEQLHKSFKLNQNYPNPFNPQTVISFSLSRSEFVSLRVYDILGNQITTLVNEQKSAGNFNVIFDANNFSSGKYFYQIKANNFCDIKKMTLIK